MPLWLIATGLGIALPMLFKKDGTPAQGQGPTTQGQGNFFPGGVSPQFPPPSSYPIPFDRTIDPQSAYAVYQAWQTAPAATLKAFAQEIFNQFPIAATALFARGLTLEQIQQAQQAHAARMQAEAQRAAAAPVAPAPAPVAVQPPQAFAGGMIPATQAARIVPTPSIQPEGAPQVVPSSLAATNGAPAPAVAAPVAAPSPVAVGVG